MAAQVDFGLYREALAASTSALPIPLPVLDRKETLQQHAASIAVENELDGRGEVRSRRFVLGPGKHYSRASFETLVPTPLEALQCNQAAQGKVLVCRIISSSLRAVAVSFIVEDQHGRVAPVHVHHISSRYGQLELNELYPRGAIFAIREPYMVEARGGFRIRIDSPADLLRLYTASPLLFDATSRRLYPAPTMTAGQYKEAGNRAFASGRWAKALEAYSFALDLISDWPEHRLLRQALLSNRAATLLKAQRPGGALKDALSALALEPLEKGLKKKLLHRAAMARYQLSQWEEASAHISQLQEIDAEESVALDLSKSCQQRLKEAESGVYDWPVLFASSLPSDFDVAEYMGPVKKAAIPGKNNGLVATRDIARGELLLVCRPLASAIGSATGEGKGKGKAVVVGINLYTESMDPYPFVELVALLIERALDDPACHAKVMALHAGKFGPGDAWGVVDVSRFEAAATFNSFHTEPLTASAATSSSSAPEAVSSSSHYALHNPQPGLHSEADAQDDNDNIHAPSSLYALPSLMNHSCIGNVSYAFLTPSHSRTPIIFLRAKRALAVGEECVDSYTDALDELDQRTTKLAGHGFTCTCPLCIADRLDTPAQRSSRAALAARVEELTDRIHRGKQPSSPHKNVIMDLVDSLEQTYSSHRTTNRVPRPALYRAYRLLSQLYAETGEDRAAISVELQALGTLGGEMELTGKDQWEMKIPPAVGDVNAVLSALFIAKQFRLIGKIAAASKWIDIAREIERGQAGVELFASRYSAFAARHGLQLETE